MGSSSIAVQKREGEGIRIENPFTLKVGQVFTGFGIGCGVGIGVGRPLNIGAIPVLNEVMSATRGATSVFSGVGRHVNSSLRKLGATNVQAGIGCGVGLGHGFGVGFALKPGVMNQVQSVLLEVMHNIMTKFKIAPTLVLSQGAVPLSLPGISNTTSGTPHQNPVEDIMHMATRVADNSSQCAPRNKSKKDPSKRTPDSFGSRTEEVISSFQKNPIFKEGSIAPEEPISSKHKWLQSEKNMLHMILKHQQAIDELTEENKKLRQILVEDLKVPASKLQASDTAIDRLCSDCFECRRKQRRGK